MAAANEQLARAEPRCYTWSFPGSPVKVRIDLEVVKRLEAQLRSKGAAAVESGLLLGTAVGATTVISDSQAIANPVAPEMRRAVAGAAGVPVGFYRIRGEGGLRLNSEDISLAEELFRQAHQVFLLIQPAESGPANATFFFRDKGFLNGDFSFMEFPFDSESLAKAELHKVERVQEEAEWETPATVAAGIPSSGSHPGRRRVAWLVMMLAVAAAAGAAGALYFPRVLSRFVPAAAQWAAQPTLGLVAVRQDPDLKLTWNRAAPVVANATSGLLSIQDGSTQRVIALSAAQVHAGSVLYTPVSDQVQMWLTVSGPAGTAIESIIEIDPLAGTYATAVRTPGRASGVVNTIDPAAPYYPPQAVLEVKPNVPANLRRVMSGPSTVEVKVSIDAAGNVVETDVVPRAGTNPSFIDEAVAAARQWKFRPARRGDRFVPSGMLLRFNFNPL